MSLDAAKIQGLIERELSLVSDPRIADLIRSLLVEPRELLLGWDYGEPGDQFPCCTVLREGSGSNGGVVYSEHGFGPSSPWGLVSLGDGGSMGMDCQWFRTFLETFFNSYAVRDLPIWRVYSGDDDAFSQPLTDELSWEDAWARCYALRERDPRCRVDHPAAYIRE